MNRSLLLAALAASVPAVSAPALAASNSTLGTPEQLAAERTLARLFADPRVQASVAVVEADLAASDPAAATPEGRGRLRNAVRSWAASYAYREISSPSRPAFLLSAEDTPRRWFGHETVGAGIGGDNPDNVYRWAKLEGAGRYEIRGQLPANPPTQFSFEVSRAKGTFKVSKGNPDMGNQVAFLADTRIATDSSGHFVITLDQDSTEGRANHIRLEPGVQEITFRNTFSDWRQQPIAVSIRRLDAGAPAKSEDPGQIAERVAAGLPAFVKYWSTFKEGWLGGPVPNTLAPPVPRDGGWGYLTGGRYDLKDDEALVITTTDGGARYTGVQISDRWFITPSSREVFTSLNKSQAEPNADGSVTYVISPTDPGTANWISTGGLHQGFLVLRWQQIPSTADAGALLRTVKVVKLPALKSELPADVRPVTPAERASALAARAASYDQRLKSGS